MGTEGISKGLEPPASSLSAPLAPGYLSCSCAAPPKGTELSLAQGKVPGKEPGSRKEAGGRCRHGSMNFPVLPFPLGLLAIFSPQDCSSVCP